MDGHEWTAFTLTHWISSLPFSCLLMAFSRPVREQTSCESWCVYNYAVIKLIYDEKTRDKVADNFYHLDGYSYESWKTIESTGDVHINQPGETRGSHLTCTFRLIEWDWKRRQSSEKNCFTHAVIVFGQGGEEGKKRTMWTRTRLWFTAFQCKFSFVRSFVCSWTETKSMHENFIDEKPQEMKIFMGVFAPLSHVLRKPSKIVNLFMTSFHPSSFGIRWSIVWSSAFVARVAEVERKVTFQSRLDSINHIEEFAA